MGYKQSYGTGHKHYKYDFALSKNPYGCSEKVMQAYIDSVNTISSYPTSEQDLIDKLSQSINIHKNNIAITAGSVQALDMIGDTLLTQNSDEVIIPALTFEEFRYSIDKKNVKIIRSKMLENGNIDLEDIKNKITENTKLVYIVNPNNPTGCALPTEKIAELALLLKNGYLIIDEANIEFAPHIDSALSYFNFYKNLIVTRTFSKAYGLAGLRAGYLCASLDVIEKLEDNYPPFKCTEVTYKAAIAALEDTDFINSSVTKIKDEYHRISPILTSLGIEYIPSDAHTVLIKTPKEFQDLDAFINYLDSKDIGVVKVKDYNAIRVIISTFENNNYFLKTLQDRK